MMEGVLVVVPSYRGPSTIQRRQLRALAEAGAELHVHEGVSDVSLARSQAFTHALTTHTGDVMFCLDDDIVLPLDGVRLLVEAARKDGRAHSGVYMSSDHTMCATPYMHDDESRKANRWLVGLGCLAVPMQALREVAKKLHKVKGPKSPTGTYDWVYPFCTSGGFYGGAAPVWHSDDYSFCHKLGGVSLDNVPAGHIKPQPMWPHPDDVAAVARGESLERKVS